MEILKSLLQNKIMKIDTIKIEENDEILILHSIGGMPSEKIDAYCKKLIPTLASIFGTGQVSLFPVREGQEWDFTIIKKSPSNKIKKVVSNRKK